MPLAKKTGLSAIDSIPENLKNQIKLNFSDDVNIKESTPKSKNKYSDVVNLHLSKGKRNEFKTFFTSYEITMNQGFESAVDYIIREVKAGRLIITKAGIAKLTE